LSAAALLAAMQAAGLEPHTALDLVDGKLVRYRVTGDKPGSRNGWVVLHGDVQAGAFGSWRTGESHTWRGRIDGAESPAAAAERRRRLAELRQQQEQEQARVQDDAIRRAARLLQAARRASDSHPYLRRKGVRAYGIRQLREQLVIPIRDSAGVTRSIQFIDPDGSKRFLTGGQVQGCYFAIGALPGPLLVCEGYATGATLHEACGYPVAVSFNAGNLEPVARAIRAKYPSAKLVVCADDDANTPGNPGLTKARAAARAVGAALAVPKFEERAA